MSVALPQTNYKGQGLDCVKDNEDRNLIQDIISVLDKTQHILAGCQVRLQKGHYEIIGNFNAQHTKDWEIFFSDLETIKQINPWRISIVSVAMVANVPQLRVVVIPHSERIVIHETDILRVTKKRRWLDYFSF
jgi:hypothetical protein